MVPGVTEPYRNDINILKYVTYIVYHELVCPIGINICPIGCFLFPIGTSTTLCVWAGGSWEAWLLARMVDRFMGCQGGRGLGDGLVQEWG